ncbi:signal peptide peptidase SppA [Sinorhizobium americanum]|uniref:Protease-4 n=1 Tax=Sinorhizobium americanum TaxID=194963 RepID=A0A1L3LI11_9HYPH|nr:signal peptide peptidase SppA [Sinorhizobium americanum]APG83187.1 signal peptide peptidase SppA [Sinorhizobium americanum CCGM7]APG89727.1 signal peptide peptidase SppA [Sinorhizobium americanum]OAP47054.1 Clp protease [Sinorhizobium americanum]TCN36200.1 protease-4 [Sinorhizobium americanum]
MDELAIADRRSLRRKLSFWRWTAAAILVLGGFALVAFSGWTEVSERAREHVARVTVTGVIQDDRELVERLESIADNSSAKALIVTISSPGGTTYGGEVLYKAIRKVAAKKPVVSDVRTLAASAGYMIALAGDRIVAGETSITGSIGVIFQYPQVKQLMDKVGVSLESIKSRPLKAEPSPFHPPSPEARAMIQTMIDDSYNWFVDLVAERRKLPRTEALALADGRIFTGRQALRDKLVDTIGGDDEIRAFLAERKVSKDLPVVDWKDPGGSFPFGFSTVVSNWLKLLGYDAFPAMNGLEKIGGDKLFLDGLVSVWQVDAQ